MLLLYTERPVLLDRERETHDWMFGERPWERFGLFLAYDNAPGGWMRYADVFRATWEAARSLGTGLIVVESDVVPTLEAFRSVLACREPVCVYPYVNSMLGETPHHGAIIERRMPGGWHSGFAEEGDEWCVDADLGFVRFSAEAMKPHPFPVEGMMRTTDVLINTALFRMFWDSRACDDAGRIHLHWPALKNNHDTWDPGDEAHHPPERHAEMRRIHARWLDPSLK